MHQYLTSLFILVGAVAATGPVMAVDLRDAAVVVQSGEVSPGEGMAGVLLVEEVKKRTGISWELVTRWPTSGAVIAITTRDNASLAGRAVPSRAGENLPEIRPEGYRIVTDSTGAQHVIWIIGADGRGAMFGAGHLLRSLDWMPGEVALQEPLDVATAPEYPLRGHQLGYRNQSNSYDAWDVETYEQYIRDLVVFGTNAIEQIPFQDDRVSPHFPIPRHDMNVAVSAICARYDLEYWIWTPAEFHLGDEEKRARHLEEHARLYREAPRLDGVFFPGGDPGRNHPEYVMPFLEDLAALLAETHPNAKIWLSIQWFDEAMTDDVFEYLDRKKPTWFAGMVMGPGAPPLIPTRRRLPEHYKLRHYPDITHTIRSQYPTPWWDPAFNATLGREPINPEPLRYGMVHNEFAPYTDGFITYSDGINDDVNKIVWSMLGWDTTRDVRDILIAYSRYFFGRELAERAADGIIQLEQNWRGPLYENAAVDAALSFWKQIDSRHAAHLQDNWRWQCFMLRAHYDAYTRHRLIYEHKLELEANKAMIELAQENPEAAMDAALAIYNKAETQRILPDCHQTIVKYCDTLFESIGLQTSVERHQASHPERGCILDFIHYPLNSRWWVEDQFKEIRALDSKAEKTERILTIATWEHPGPGSFYDDIGNVWKNPRRIRSEDLTTDPLMERNHNAGFMWWDDGWTRKRPSWVSYQSAGTGLRYNGLDPKAAYTLRVTGYRNPLVFANGELLHRAEEGVKKIGEFMHFPIPEKLYQDGFLIITWRGDATEETALNWREHSRFTEAWLLKNP